MSGDAGIEQRFFRRSRHSSTSTYFYKPLQKDQIVTLGAVRSPI